MILSTGKIHVYSYRESVETVESLCLVFKPLGGDAA